MNRRCAILRTAMRSKAVWQCPWQRRPDWRANVNQGFLPAGQSRENDQLNRLATCL